MRRPSNRQMVAVLGSLIILSFAVIERFWWTAATAAVLILGHTWDYARGR